VTIAGLAVTSSCFHSSFPLSVQLLSQLSWDLRNSQPLVIILNMPSTVHQEQEEHQHESEAPQSSQVGAQSDLFLTHVRASCLKRFSPLYFCVGLVEELAELEEQLDVTGEGRVVDKDQVLAETGDVLWYLYGLTDSLGDIVVTHDMDTLIPETDTSTQELLQAVGTLCGSVKKWSRGDKTWELFRDRIQAQVNHFFRLLSSRVNAYCSIEEAKRNNISKIQTRRERGVIKGDGNNR